MKTAVEMDKYVQDNKLIYYGSTALKHFKLIETVLLSDEDVILAYAPSAGAYEVGAVAFTNKNLIVAHKGFLNTYTISVGLNDICDIETDLSGFLDGEIRITSSDKEFKLKFGKKAINRIYPQIVAFLDDYKKKQQENKKRSQGSVADEIQNMQNLLNQGVITKEEFDTFKKRLLGL